MKRNLPILWLICLFIVLQPVTTYAADNDDLNYVVCYGEIGADRVPVYTKESKKSKIIGFLNYGDTVHGKLSSDEKWIEVKYNNTVGYVLFSKVDIGEVPSRIFNMPANSGYKSFMHSSSIKSWDPAKVKKLAKVGKYGILTVNDRYCVAIGTKANVSDGQYFDAILKNGTVIKCIKCDTKDNRDTLSNNMITRDNGCSLEFVVDKAQLDSKIRGSGDVSSASKDWNSPVVRLEIYNRNVLK